MLVYLSLIGQWRKDACTTHRRQRDQVPFIFSLSLFLSLHRSHLLSLSSSSSSLQPYKPQTVSNPASRHPPELRFELELSDWVRIRGSSSRFGWSASRSVQDVVSQQGIGVPHTSVPRGGEVQGVCSQVSRVGFVFMFQLQIIDVTISVVNCEV